MRLTTLHNLSQMDLVDRSGEKIGRIRDVLLDLETGRGDYLLMSAETGPFSFGGGGGNLTPIPLSLITRRETSLALDADRDVIQGAPSFSPKDVGSFSADYREKLNSFWGIGRGEATRHGPGERAPAYARREEEEQFPPRLEDVPEERRSAGERSRPAEQEGIREDRTL